MSFLIATPARGQAMNVDYTIGLMHSAGLHGGWMPMGGQSDLYIARNGLLNEFLKTKHDQLVCIDSDIGFLREDLQNLVTSPAPFVSGLYPGKGDHKGAVFVPLDADRGIPLPTEGLVEAKFVPFGFLCLHRSVLEAMKASVPEYGHEDRPNYQFVNGEIVDRNLLSEDYSFCARARRAGFTPMINCKVRVKHDGRSLG
jgi:hypothetical protein